MIEVLTSLCAGRSGCGGARDRALLAVTAINQTEPAVEVGGGG